MYMRALDRGSTRSSLVISRFLEIIFWFDNPSNIFKKVNDLFRGIKMKKK